MAIIYNLLKIFYLKYFRKYQSRYWYISYDCFNNYGIIKCTRRRNNNNNHRNLSVRFDTLNERIGLIDQRLNSTRNNTQSTNTHSAQEQRVIPQDDTIIQDIRIRMDRLNNN